MAKELYDSRTPILAIHHLYDDFGLTLEAFRVLCHFARRAGAEEVVTASYAEIGEACFKGSYPNASVSTLKAKAVAAIGELIDARLVSKKAQASGEIYSANSYGINYDPESWNDNFHPDPSSPNVRKGRAAGLKRQRSQEGRS